MVILSICEIWGPLAGTLLANSHALCLRQTDNGVSAVDGCVSLLFLSTLLAQLKAYLLPYLS